MPVPIAFPLRRRLPRSRHSSGQSRDHHGISIREERLCNRLYRLIKLQARILCMHPDDEETETMLLDFIEVYIDRMYRRAHVLPRPVRTRAASPITMKTFNGVSLRHNDLFVLSLSDSNQKLADLQMTGGVPNARQFKIYGDSIYVPMSNLVSRHHAHAGHPQKADLDRDDKAMSSVRETVEWEYAEGDALLPLSVYKNKIKLMNFPFRETFFARMWLRNCYVCCYGDKISKRFDLQPPTLEVGAPEANKVKI